jgi:hypothetical protein
MLSHTQTELPIQRLFRWARSVLFYEHWMVGIIDQPIANALNWTQAPPIRWVASFDKNYYFADPFPWPGSSDTIICERYDTAQRHGHIVALKLNEKDGGIRDEVNIDLPIKGHLSFPFLFVHEGTVYAMPESCAANRLEIFRCQEPSGVWVSHAVVLENHAVADAVLFERSGLFWISYTDVTQDPHDNLNLLYAPTLTGPWQPHPANPVRRGRESSRNGGAIFEIDGELYRPAQDCSHVYGGGLRIMKITTLTQTAYEEQEVTHIEPSSPTYPDGFHTLQSWGEKCLVDGMRLTFSPRLIGQKLCRRLGLSHHMF